MPMACIGWSAVGHGAMADGTCVPRRNWLRKSSAERPCCQQVRHTDISVSDRLGRSLLILLVLLHGQESRQLEGDQSVRIEFRDDDGARPAVTDHAGRGHQGVRENGDRVNS